MKFRETGEAACCCSEPTGAGGSRAWSALLPTRTGCCGSRPGDRMAAGGEVEGLPPGQLLTGVRVLKKGLISNCDLEWDGNEISLSGLSAASGVVPALGNAIPGL